MLPLLRRHLAAMNAHLPVVRRLLAAGADVTARACFDGTPLYLAAQGCTLPAASGGQRAAVVQALIDAGSEVNTRVHISRGGTPPVYAAARFGHAGALAALARAGADVEARSLSRSLPGRRPLHVAAAEVNVECVRTLLAAGADPAAADGAGLTPGDWARSQAAESSATILELLAEAVERRQRCAVWGLFCWNACHSDAEGALLAATFAKQALNMYACTPAAATQGGGAGGGGSGPTGACHAGGTAAYVCCLRAQWPRAAALRGLPGGALLLATVPAPALEGEPCFAAVSWGRSECCPCLQAALADSTLLPRLHPFRTTSSSARRRALEIESRSRGAPASLL